MTVDNSVGSNGWIDRFERRHNIVYGTAADESKTADPETLDDWKYDQQLQKINEYDMCGIYNADKTGLFFNQQPSNSLTFCGNPCHGGMKSKQLVTVLLACSAESTNTLLIPVIVKYR